MSYCVSCKGKIEQRPGVKRCLSCWKKNKKEPPRVQWTIHEGKVMRVSTRSIVGGAPAIYCYTCGDKIPDQARFYAISHGGEALYCAPHSPSFIRRWTRPSTN